MLTGSKLKILPFLIVTFRINLRSFHALLVCGILIDYLAENKLSYNESSWFISKKIYMAKLECFSTKQIFALDFSHFNHFAFTNVIVNLIGVNKNVSQSKFVFYFDFSLLSACSNESGTFRPQTISSPSRFESGTFRPQTISSPSRFAPKTFPPWSFPPWSFRPH